MVLGAVMMVVLSGCDASEQARDHTLSVIGIPTLEQEVILPDGTVSPTNRVGPQLVYFEQGSSDEGCFIQISADEASEFVNAVTEKPIGNAPDWGLADADYFVIQAPSGDVAGSFGYRQFRNFDGIIYSSIDTNQFDEQIDKLTSRYGCVWR